MKFRWKATPTTEYAIPETPPFYYYMADKPLSVTANGVPVAGVRLLMRGDAFRIEAPVDPVDGLLGPFTESELGELYLKRQQEEWDRIQQQRLEAWDKAYERACQILTTANTESLKDLQLLIFQIEYGYGNKGPEMTEPRPTEPPDWTWNH